MYWTSSGRIQRANLDGSNIEYLIIGLDFLFDLALDVVGRQDILDDIGRDVG